MVSMKRCMSLYNYTVCVDMYTYTICVAGYVDAWRVKNSRISWDLNPRPDEY